MRSVLILTICAMAYVHAQEDSISCSNQLIEHMTEREDKTETQKLPCVPNLVLDELFLSRPDEC